VLEDAGLKTTTVITDVMGVSGRAMLAPLVAGTTPTRRCSPIWRAAN
jgi:hypothetical protein